jgi:hypothetical protein
VNLQKESQSITIKLIDLKADIICRKILFSMRFMCWSLVKNKSFLNKSYSSKEYLQWFEFELMLKELFVESLEFNLIHVIDIFRI